MAHRRARLPPRRRREAELAADVRRSDQCDLLVDLTAKLDRLPRYFSVHPGRVILADASLLDGTPVQGSGMGR